MDDLLIAAHSLWAALWTTRPGLSGERAHHLHGCRAQPVDKRKFEDSWILRASPARHPDATSREVLRLAVPAFLTLVAEPAFLLADSAIVGRLGTVQLAGLGVASAALATCAGIFVFLAYGTTASVSRRAGVGGPARRPAARRGRRVAGRAARGASPAPR